ncbi:hypothetical protein R1flu_021178 [Riccia fluitans]|uniref:Exocyst subunit Exo70 family protein n=1 Tax=Riccia fluitans TaxID=41844 RepID=A0ABD1ZNY7_9MARC
MGFDVSGRAGIGARIGDGEGANFLAARSKFMHIMQKSKEVELALSKSTMRFQSMTDSLPVLQAAMKPLQAQALVVNGLGLKIERAAEPAQKVLEAFEMVRNLERILKAEPRRDFWEYIASLSQLEEATNLLSQKCVPAVQWLRDAVSFLAQSKIADHYRVYRLNERIEKVFQDIKSEEGNTFDMGLLKLALEKLNKEFRRILLDHSAPASLPDQMPVDSSSDSREEESEVENVSLPSGLSSAAADMLQAIVVRLNHQVDYLLEIYRDARLVVIKGGLENLGANEYLHYSSHKEIDKLPSEKVHGEMVASWGQHIEVVCKILFKSEYSLCTRVFRKIEKTQWIRCWGTLGTAGFLPFLAFGEAVASSRIAPENDTTLLYMYDVMDRCNDTIKEMFEGGDQACGEIFLRTKGLQKKLVFKATENLKKFIRVVAEGEHPIDGELPANGVRSRFCSYIMNYAGWLARNYGVILSKLLRVHEQLKTGVESPDDLFAKSVEQMMEALEKRLIERSSSYTDKSLGYIFMMNSYRYMITHVENEDSGLGPVLGDQWHRDMLVKLRQQSRYYQRDTWVKMLEFLKRDGLHSSNGSKGSSREVVRQRLRSFTQVFDQTCQKHTNWQITSEDLRYFKLAAAPFPEDLFWLYLKEDSALVAVMDVTRLEAPKLRKSDLPIDYTSGQKVQEQLSLAIMTGPRQGLPFDLEWLPSAHYCKLVVREVQQP